MALNYLLDPMFQIENSAGKPATDGWLEVYIHGTRNKYYCASNFDGTLHPFKIKLDSLGSNIVLADDGQAYDVYAYNRFGSLLMSRYNVQPGSGGGGSVITGEMQHWIGMYGPTYTHFPGDDAGHTLGIPRQSVDYVGDFIDHISTAPYPDGDVPAYIYLKPGLYHIDCVIRYQQDTGDIKNTLDEVLVYTGHGNANEDVAYQLDASGPETNGNRHCLKQSFIRKVTEDDGGLLYFAPGTPTDWTDAYIQTLSIVKLDSIVSGSGGLHVVYHDETMTGDGTQDNPLSIQDALDGKQDTLTPGEGINIDSDGNISSETYSEGWGIDIDGNNVISVDPDIIQQKLTPGDDIQIDSDGVISATLPEEEEVEFEELDLDDYQKKLTAGDGVTIDSDGVISAEGEKYYEGWGIDINENNEISVDPDIIQKKITTGEGLTLDSDGNLNLDLPPIIPLVAGDGVTLTDSNGELIISAEGRQYTAGEGITIDGEGNISVDPNTVQEKLTAGQNIDIDSDGVISAVLPEEEEVEFEELDLDDYQTKLTAGQNITIDSNGVISASGGGSTYTAGNGIDIDSDGVISVDQNTVAMKSDIPEEEEVQFDLFNPSAYQIALTAGNGIDLDSDGNISVDTSVVQEKLTAGQNIDIDSDGVISSELPQEEEVQFDLFDPSAYQKALVAGNGINLDSDGNISVNTNVVQEKLTAGQNIDIDSDGVISAELPQEEEVDFEEIDLDDYQTKLTAGQNITIDSDGVISASGGGSTYTAGNGINITNDEISIDTDVVQEKLTAGQNIEIDSDGVISAAGGASNVFVAEVGTTPYDDIKAAVDAGKVVIARWNRIQLGIVSDWTDMWGDPAYLFGVMWDQYQGGFPKRLLYRCRKLSNNTTEWVKTQDGELALQSNMTSALNAKQDKLTAGQNIDIDSDGVISVDPEALPSYDSLPIEAGPGISIAVVDGKLRISLS